MAIKSYRDLEAYQRAKKLIGPVYQLVETFPASEKFDLCDQMRRACKSVVTNIVEGYSHKDTPIKAKSFWRTSMGSANEMVEHLEQAVTLEYTSTENAQLMIEEYVVVAKQLNKLIQNWRKL
ncbi:MAG TPA: four helix bundle protein [Anaerolineae bacterium]|nr:four helix bundle protein [Anaerolineae bacterium]